MPWWDRLEADELQELRDRCPGRSYDQIAVEVIRKHPGIAEEVARLGLEIVEYDQRGLFMASWPPELFPRWNVTEPVEVAFAKLVLLAARDAGSPMREDDERASGQGSDDKSGRVTIPYALVEAAVLLHVEKGLGRRPLGREIVGLGEWSAHAVLYSLNTIGKPAGLWLDEDDQLRWGPAIAPIWDREQGWEQRKQPIAPTPAALRLPRPVKPA